MEIEELPDLKVDWDRGYEYLDVPLLDYVWAVANKYRPSVQETEEGIMIPADSVAPAIFSNRYFERNLTPMGRYERAIEMGMRNASFEEYSKWKREYRKLDDSFKEKFLNNKDLQNTIEAFGLDVSKFWYLLLFVYDYIEDIGTNAPVLGKSPREEFNCFATNMLEATSITLKKNNRKSYTTDREDTIRIIQAALRYFVNTYCGIVEGGQDRETMIKQLEDMGLDDFVSDSTQYNFDGKYNLDISYKKWKFAEIFLYFLEDKKATTIPNKKEKVSKDKMIFISRLIYTVGYDGKRYNEEYDEDGNKNRMLSNLLRKYSKEEFPTVRGHYYLG